MDLSNAPLDVSNAVFRSLAYKDRCTCALVCTAWADAATAATCSIVLKDKKRDMASLQLWIAGYGHQLEDLQLHGCCGSVLAALPCAQLHNLLLHGYGFFSSISTDSRVWSDIAAATQLTSLSLARLQTAFQQADVVSALAALTGLQQLTWCAVKCSGERKLSDSLLLQQLTSLTSLELKRATAAAFRHVTALSKLQQLKVAGAVDWAAAGCPGLEGLQALTSLQLQNAFTDMPASISQLTALQQLDVSVAQYASLLQLHALASLTQLRVKLVAGTTSASAPLPLPALKHLELLTRAGNRMPMTLLSGCEELQDVSLSRFTIKGPGPLVVSSNLQRLVLDQCSMQAAPAAAGQPRVSAWQQVFAADLQLPHLTALQLPEAQPALQSADLGLLMGCCPNLRVLNVHAWLYRPVTTLLQLQHLTNLTLGYLHDDLCSTLAQLTELLQLKLNDSRAVTVVGWRQLAADTVDQPQHVLLRRAQRAPQSAQTHPRKGACL
jgi:hypothetical protein